MVFSHQDIQYYIQTVEFAKRVKQQCQAGEILRHGSFVGGDVVSKKNMNRTMELAREDIISCCKTGKSFINGTIYIAESLNCSKGRFDRVWHAPEGGLWGCIVHISTLLPKHRNLVPLSLGLSCCQAIHDVGGKNASVRWVNDVLLSNRKVAGFLAESFVDPVFHESYDLLGFGINVNNTDFPEEIKNIAVGLKEAVGKTVDIHRFAVVFFAKLSWNMGLLYYEEKHFLQEGRYSGKNGEHLLLADWKKYSSTIGKRVVFGFDVEKKVELEGTVMHILDDGGLVIGFDDGTSVIEYSGEIRYL